MTILLPGGTTMPVRQRSWTWSWPISRRSPAEINRAPPEAPALKMTQP